MFVARTLSVAKVRRSMAAAGAGVVISVGIVLPRSGPGLGRRRIMPTKNGSYKDSTTYDERD